MTTRTTMTTLLLALAALVAPAIRAQPDACLPCAAIAVDDPVAAAEVIGREPLSEEEVLFVKWSPATAEDGIREAVGVGEVGAIPWLTWELSAPRPLSSNVERLAGDLRGLAELAAGAPAGSHFEIVWT